MKEKIYLIRFSNGTYYKDPLVIHGAHIFMARWEAESMTKSAYVKERGGVVIEAELEIKDHLDPWFIGGCR